MRPLFDIRIETKEGTLLIDKICDVEIDQDWNNMTDTGTLKLPRKSIVANTTTKIADLIRPGDKIVVRLGIMAHNIEVNHRMVTEFVGYVSATPKPLAPVEIKIENEMYSLKRLPVKAKTFKKGDTVKDLIKYIAPGYRFEAINAEIGGFVVNTGTAAQALKKLQETHGLRSFFRTIPDLKEPDGARSILVTGLPYSSSDLLKLLPADDLIYTYGKNVIDNDLEYKKSNENRIKIKATNRISNGKDYSITVGDDDGHEIKKEYTDLSDAALRKYAEAELKKRKVDRFEGTLTSFGFPYARPGRIIKYLDWRYGFVGESQRYFIDGVKINSGEGGYKRTLKIGWLASTPNIKREI